MVNSVTNIFFMFSFLIEPSLICLGLIQDFNAKGVLRVMKVTTFKSHFNQFQCNFTF